MEPENDIQEPDNMEPEYETQLGQRSQMTPPKKGNSKKIIGLIIVLLLAVGGSYAYITLNGTSKKDVKQTTKTTESRKKVDPEIKKLQVALDELSKLFVDGKSDEYRTDVTDKEFETAEKAIDKVENKDLKKELSDKLKEVKNAQNQGQGDQNTVVGDEETVTE